MNNPSLTIDVAPRQVRGKKNKQLRNKKQIPAIVYGLKQKNLAFSLDLKQALKFYKKEYENKIFTFQSANKDLNGLKVIRKDVDIHKINRLPIHMDFLSLDMNTPIRVHVEVVFKGTPKGVKEEGGVFNIILRSVEVECLPDKIPNSLDLDVSQLELNQNFHVSDLKISKDLKLITKPERTLCTVVMVAEEETPTPAESAEGATPAEGAEGAPAEAPAEGEATPEAKKAEESPSEDKKDKK